MRFRDKVVLVTGSGRGIGAAIARAFAAEGAGVVVNDVDERCAVEVAERIRSGGARAVGCAGDVARRADVQRMVDAAGELGAVDILINNAAITRPAMLTKLTDEDWDAVLGVNLTGVFYCTQTLGGLWTRRARERPDRVCNGKIVNVTSVAALRGTVGQVNYAASKAGVVAVTMSAAREWGRYGINVNCVAFGLVETRMTETIRSDPRFRDQYSKQIVLGRYARPEDVAPAVLFLASPDADYITGQVLNVCGGADIHV